MHSPSGAASVLTLHPHTAACLSDSVPNRLAVPTYWKVLRLMRKLVPQTRTTRCTLNRGTEQVKTTAAHSTNARLYVAVYRC